MIDILKMQFREFSLLKNPDCEACSKYCNMPAEKNNEPGVPVQEYIIFPQELNELMKNNADIQLVDVRTIEKHDAFNIGGKHIPTAELPDRFNELDPAKPVITYCTSGGNSMRALQFLLSVGFRNVKSLEGGMTAWQRDITRHTVTKQA
jgi:sulfur-carrier protein adenylyltransferase/sulfurtransferase